MRILLIGGTGFIGPFVVDALARSGHDIAVFHRGTKPSSLPANVRHILGDRHCLAESAEGFHAFAPEVVIDLILSSGSQARETMDILRGVARRIVALSSMDVYRACGVLHGSEPGPLERLPLTESSPLRTRLKPYPPAQLKMLKGLFGWLDDDYDKIPVEHAILSDRDLPGTVLRLPMVYGPGDPLHRFYPILKRIDQRRPVIAFDEPVARWRSPRGFVANVAAAIALAAISERAAGRVYNVAETDSLSEIEWAQQIARAAGWGGEFVTLPSDRAPVHLRRPGNLDQHWVVETARIREELGYREPIARDEAIRRTIEWERAHPPVQASSDQFEYAAEDIAVQKWNSN
jgi:nucleoside-diphosphate-sugar epimerase